MFVRPPGPRSTRNPGRRPMPNRVPLNELNRPLLRQFIRNRRSDPRHEAYILEVREGPAVNGNTNAAASKSIPQPWVTVRDYVMSSQSIGLPVSVCDTLLKHLLTCVVSEEPTHVDSSEESDLVCGSPAASADPQGNSPARASGDAKSPMEEGTSGENSPHKKSPFRAYSKVFQLSRLNPIRIMCDATGCILEVTARDPTAKRAPANSDEPEQPVPIDPSQRWIVSAPLETRPTINSTSEQSTENTATASGRRKHPWETRGMLKLHESLMPQFSAFLTDVVTRYRSVSQLPEVRSLYSASGGRRFFFDLRDTRWGKRLHISQVTDLHRNVIGIPLEALVSFRTRLDMVICSLGLEDQHVLRSEIYRAAPDRTSPRGQGRTVTTSPDRSKDVVHPSECANNTLKVAQSGATRGELPSANRQRGRERRRQRVRSFTGAPSAGGPPINATRSAEVVDRPLEPNARRSAANGPNAMGGSNQWNGNAQRNRRFPRRNRNPRPFHPGRRTPPGDTEGHLNESAVPVSVQSAPEPAIDGGRVAPVAQASA